MAQAPHSNQYPTLEVTDPPLAHTEPQRDQLSYVPRRWRRRWVFALVFVAVIVTAGVVGGAVGGVMSRRHNNKSIQTDTGYGMPSSMEWTDDHRFADTTFQHMKDFQRDRFDLYFVNNNGKNNGNEFPGDRARSLGPRPRGPT